MGYDSTLYLVRPFEIDPEDEYPSGQLIAQFEMACMGEDVMAVIRKSPRSTVFIWEHLDPYRDEEMEERLIRKDAYGEKPRMIKIKKLIKAMRESNWKEPYRRFACALAFMEEAVHHWDDLVVLHYGH